MCSSEWLGRSLPEEAEITPQRLPSDWDDESSPLPFLRHLPGEYVPPECTCHALCGSSPSLQALCPCSLLSPWLWQSLLRVIPSLEKMCRVGSQCEDPGGSLSRLNILLLPERGGVPACCLLLLPALPAATHSRRWHSSRPSVSWQLAPLEKQGWQWKAEISLWPLLSNGLLSLNTLSLSLHTL